MNSKAKGGRGERELAHVLQGYGYNTQRGQQFQGGVDSPDVKGLPGIHIECKRVENLNIHKAYAQAERDADGQAIPAVFHRRNREPWMVTLKLDDFMEIYKAWQRDECLQKQ
jgi:Holliday junction resolvase